MTKQALEVNEKTSFEEEAQPPLGMGHNIFLLGMMGAGKTYWAQRLSEQSGRDWIDLDAQVEKAAGMTVREIFESRGEDYFRKKEREVLQQLSSLGNLIIAAGGGTPCFFENMQWMNKNGVTVWIDPPVNILVERLKKGKAHRPLIRYMSDDEIKDFLSEKLEDRKPFYSLAQYHLQDEKISLHSFAQILGNNE